MFDGLCVHAEGEGAGVGPDGVECGQCAVVKSDGEGVDFVGEWKVGVDEEPLEVWRLW